MTDPRWPVNEAALLNAVRELAHLYRWRTYHTYDSRRSEPGFPDLVLIRPPRLLFVELKSSGRSPTALQRAWLDALDEVTDVETYVWRPADLDRASGVLGRKL